MLMKTRGSTRRLGRTAKRYVEAYIPKESEHMDLLQFGEMVCASVVVETDRDNSVELMNVRHVASVLWSDE